MYRMREYARLVAYIAMLSTHAFERSKGEVEVGFFLLVCSELSRAIFRAYILGHFGMNVAYLH